MESVTQGWLESSQYAGIFKELTANEGVLLKGNRLVIPKNLHADVSALAHEGHSGGDRTTRALRERVWFLRLSAMCKEYAAMCTPCLAAVPANPPAPLNTRELPEGPWLQLAADFKGPIGGTNGYYFHVLIDMYSRYPEVAIVKSTSFSKLEAALDQTWAAQGFPESITHDGGPPYNGKKWKEYGRQCSFKSDKCPALSSSPIQQ